MSVMTAESIPCQLIVTAWFPPSTNTWSGSGGGGGFRSIVTWREEMTCGVPSLLLMMTKIVCENDSTGRVQVGLGVNASVVPPSIVLATVYVLMTRAFVSIEMRPSFRKAASGGEASCTQRWLRNPLLFPQSLPTQNSMLPVRSTEVRLAKPLLVSAT